MTHERALRNVLPTPAAYIGVIGSQRKIDTIMEHLRTDGFTDDQLARVRAPIGMDLGGWEMAQIALAIMAEIEVVRHGGSGQPRSEGMKIILLCVYYHYPWHTGRLVFWKLHFLRR